MLPPHKHYATLEKERAARLRAEARSPVTSPARLREMALDRYLKGKRVREALAANPSTPPDALAHLVREAPAAFCRNPVAPLLALEQPDFIEKVSAGGVRQMLRCARAPAPLVTQAAAVSPRVRRWGNDVAEAARLHVTQHSGEIPDDEWVERVRGYWQEYGKAVTREENRQRHELYELTELAGVPPEWTVYEDGSLEGEDFAGFLRRAEAEFGADLVKDMERFRQTPPQWAFSYDTAGRRIYLFVAGAFSPSAQPKQLEEWSGHHPWFALAAAQNPNATPTLLDRLFRSADPAVRRAALRHPAAPPGARETARRLLFRRVLRTYEDDGEWIPQAPYLLGRFAAMLEAPDTMRRPLWHRFAHSPLWQDRLAVAVSIGPRPNGQPPRARHQVLLRYLTNDGNILVRAAARARLRGESFHF